MNPRQYLELAERLAQGAGAAECRSAVSRSYYAVYNVAEQFLSRMGFGKPGKNYHVALQQRLLNSQDDEVQRVGSQLGDLHERRLRADYHMDDKTTEHPKTAEAACRQARRMIEVLDLCPINSERWKQIQTAIAQAESKASGS
jgi:hypothetical protein